MVLVCVSLRRIIKNKVKMYEFNKLLVTGNFENSCGSALNYIIFDEMKLFLR